MNRFRLEQLARLVTQDREALGPGDLHDTEWQNIVHLTLDERLDGWHFCPSFDGLLTQGEGAEAPTLCTCGKLRPFSYTFEGSTYRVYPAIHSGGLCLDHVHDDFSNDARYTDLVPPDYVEIRDFPEIERVLVACFDEAKRRYGSIVQSISQRQDLTLP